MGRGYWYPPNGENLAACDGFLIDSRAVYKTEIENDWNAFLNTVCEGLKRYNPKLETVNSWKSVDVGESRYVLLTDGLIEVIAEDTDGYVAAFVIIPETTSNKEKAKRIFGRYYSDLKKLLCENYPGFVKKRLNSQHLEDVG